MDINPADLDAAALDAAIHKQGDKIRHLKAQGATKDAIATVRLFASIASIFSPRY